MFPRVVVVGAGYWGKNLVRNFYELGHLYAICDRNEFLMAGFSKDYPNIPFLTDYESVLADENVDAVVVATPAAMHYGMVKTALLMNKHVLVEKPLSLSVSEGEELVNLAQRKNRVLMVGHILQYHPAVQKLKELIVDGHLGKILYVYSNRLNIGKIRTEENILWSFAPHDISTILMLLNEQPDSLSAHGASYLQQNIADTTLTYFHFPSGVRAHIFVSWLHPFKEQKLVVIGDRRMAVFNDTSDEKLLVYPHEIQWKNRIPVASKAQGEVIPTGAAEPLKNECSHFVECIREGKNPRTDGHEGLRVLKILTACQELLDSGGCTIAMRGGQRAGALLERQERAGYPGVQIHESAYVDEDVFIAPGTQVWHFSHILKGSRIGKNCRIGQNVMIGPRVSVGDGCKIQNNVSVYEGVTLEDYVFCGPSMTFTNVYNPRSEISRMAELRPTLVKKGATLGANCTIVCGVTIGAYAFVGAGAVVTRDVPDHALVVGNPARHAGWMCRCGVRIRFTDNQAQCTECGTLYRLEAPNRVSPC